MIICMQDVFIGHPVHILYMNSIKNQLLTRLRHCGHKFLAHHTPSKTSDL